MLLFCCLGVDWLKVRFCARPTFFVVKLALEPLKNFRANKLAVVSIMLEMVQLVNIPRGDLIFSHLDSLHSQIFTFTLHLLNLNFKFYHLQTIGFQLFFCFRFCHPWFSTTLSFFNFNFFNFKFHQPQLFFTSNFNFILQLQLHISTLNSPFWFLQFQISI